ncbi:MAG: hypothetical protein ACLT98_09820 [Eggerthellaceae bacterium]
MTIMIDTAKTKVDRWPQTVMRVIAKLPQGWRRSSRKPEHVPCCGGSRRLDDAGFTRLNEGDAGARAARLLHGAQQLSVIAFRAGAQLLLRTTSSIVGGRIPIRRRSR